MEAYNHLFITLCREENRNSYATRIFVYRATVLLITLSFLLEKTFDTSDVLCSIDEGFSNLFG
ncbi:hypothetical protein P5673_027280, partial [Acropora cervicornis]